MHRHLLHNGSIRNTDELLISPGQVGFMNGWGVFSTLRVQDGVLFAFERHYDRMKHDAVRMRVPFEVSAGDLQTQLLQLVAANQAQNATLRVCIVRNRGGLFESRVTERPAETIAFTADLKNWGPGVKLTYIPHARHGASPFAGAKITSWAQNLTWYEDVHERGFDEAVLLNELGQVSECTSANIFAIKAREIWTPPARTSGCLPGVTRAVLLEECRVSAFTIRERELAPSELEQSDQVFITSTTRDLLPVIEIDGTPLAQTSHTMKALQDAFQNYKSDYIIRRRKQPALV